MNNRIVRSFDLESELIAPGRVCPKVVCGAYYDGERMHTYEHARIMPMLLKCLRDPRTYLVNQNPFFDLAAVANHHPEVLPDIFRMFDEGRVYCTKVAEQLIRIAKNEQTDRLSLGDLVLKYFKTKLVGKKEADAWRFRYAELDGKRIEEYPAEARDYVKDDVVWALKVFNAQGAPMPTFKEQMKAGWALYLMGVNGVRVDPWISQQLRDYVYKLVIQDEAYLTDVGVYRPDGTENKYRVKELVIRDYGGYEKDSRFERIKGLRLVEDAPQTLLQRVAQDFAQAESEEDRLLRFVQDNDHIKAIWLDVQKAAPDKLELLRLLADLTTPERIKLTDKGGIQATKTTLAGATDPILQRRAKAGTMKKLWEQYVPLLEIGENYPLNPFWNVLVNSGRTSCGNPNLQNLPQLPGVREAFRPHLDNWVYITSDYSTAELRTLAEVCIQVLGYSVMGDIINAKKDPHTKVAADLQRLDYEEAKRRLDAGDVLTNKLRKLGKVENFGLPGGLGAITFVVQAKGMGVIVAEYAPPEYWPNGVVDLDAPWETLLEVGAKYTKEYLKPTWLDTFPEIRDYFKYMGRVCQGPPGMSDEEKSEWCVEYTHPITGFVRGDIQYCSGCNHNFQHLAAMGAKEALYQTVKECYVVPDSPLYGSRPVAFIHDEIVIESHEDRAHDAAKRLERVMKECMDVLTPHCPSATDATIMRRWRKGAKEKFRDGRLIPYEDRDLSEAEIAKIRGAESLWHAVIDGGVEPKRAMELRGE